MKCTGEIGFFCEIRKNMLIVWRNPPHRFIAISENLRRRSRVFSLLNMQPPWENIAAYIFVMPISIWSYCHFLPLLNKLWTQTPSVEASGQKSGWFWYLILRSTWMKRNIYLSKKDRKANIKLKCPKLGGGSQNLGPCTKNCFLAWLPRYLFSVGWPKVVVQTFVDFLKVHLPLINWKHWTQGIFAFSSYQLLLIFVLRDFSQQ